MIVSLNRGTPISNLKHYNLYHGDSKRVSVIFGEPPYRPPARVVAHLRTMIRGFLNSENNIMLKSM